MTFPGLDRIPDWPQWLVIPNEIVYWRCHVDGHYYQISFTISYEIEGLIEGYVIHLREFLPKDYFARVHNGATLLRHVESHEDRSTALERRQEIADSLEMFIVLEAL